MTQIDSEPPLLGIHLRHGLGRLDRTSHFGQCQSFKPSDAVYDNLDKRGVSFSGFALTTHMSATPTF
jgi:hypothetical protein